MPKSTSLLHEKIDRQNNNTHTQNHEKKKFYQIHLIVIETSNHKQNILAERLRDNVLLAKSASEFDEKIVRWFELIDANQCRE